jgi:hypothetical protein
MGSNCGRLRATLIAGKIELTDEAFSTLIVGLNGIAYGYRVERVVNSEVKTDTELKKELSRLHRTSRTTLDILDADMTGLGQIEVLLSDAWDGSGFREFVEQLRSLSSRLELVLTMLDQNTAIRKRRQDPETWFFLAVYELFVMLTRDAEPGIAGPLHRFTIRCAALVDKRIEVPKSENSFRKRLKAALDRRTGKIEIIPRPFFPGERGPAI